MGMLTLEVGIDGRARKDALGSNEPPYDRGREEDLAVGAGEAGDGVGGADSFNGTQSPW